MKHNEPASYTMPSSPTCKVLLSAASVQRNEMSQQEKQKFGQLVQRDRFFSFKFWIVNWCIIANPLEKYLHFWYRLTQSKWREMADDVCNAVCQQKKGSKWDDLWCKTNFDGRQSSLRKGTRLKNYSLYLIIVIVNMFVVIHVQIIRD